MVTWLIKAEKFMSQDMHVWPKKIIKFITKCDGIITNCDSLVYYKVRWTVITNCGSFFITKCDRYYKVRWLLQIATMTLGPSLNRGSTVVREKSLEDQNIAGLHPLAGGQVFLYYLWWLKGHTVNSRTNSPVYKAPSFRTIFF